MRKSHKNQYVHALYRLLLTLAFFVLLSPLRAQEQVSTPAPTQSVPAVEVELTPNAPDGSVHLPLTAANGLIYVRGSVSGKEVWFLIDTGSSTILWDSKLDFPGQSVNQPGLSFDAAANAAWEQEVILPEVKIGGFVLRNVSSSRVTIPEKAVQPALRGIVLLGTPAFQNLIVTIDYQKQELVLKKPEASEKTVTPPIGGATVLDVQWATSPFERGKGVPLVQGTIGGEPASIALDTGWGGEEIAVTSRFRERIQPFLKQHDLEKAVKKVSKTLTLGGVEAETIPYLSVLLGSDGAKIGALRPATVMKALPTGADAVIGHDILRFSRVTFDFARSKVTLTPYRPGFFDDVIAIFKDASGNDIRLQRALSQLPKEIGVSRGANGETMTPVRNGAIAGEKP